MLRDNEEAHKAENGERKGKVVRGGVRGEKMGRCYIRRNVYLVSACFLAHSSENSWNLQGDKCGLRWR